MSKYYGDFNASAVVRIAFNTNDSAGAPITLAGTPAVSCYKDGSTTESTAGASLTVDFDARTGSHLAIIDTSADGTFYSAGSDFRVEITAGTVSGTSVVGVVVGSFSIANRSALRPTTAGRTLDVSATGEAGLDWANIGSPATTVGLSGTTAGDTAGTTALLLRLTLARSGYLDNLNVGGNLASHADVLAINTSSSRHLILTTVGQYERPESGSTVYTVECRTFAALDGAAVNADTTPTLTATGQTSGSLAGNLSVASNPATGVYRWTYTVASGATAEPIRFDVSATISSSTFTLSCYSQVVDEVSQTWTSTDASHLTSIFNKLPANNIADETLVLAAIGTPMQVGPVTVIGTVGTFDALITALASAHGSGSWATATGFSTLDASGIRLAVGLNTANLDTQLTTINNKTVNLPSSPAAVGSVMTIDLSQKGLVPRLLDSVIDSDLTLGDGFVCAIAAAAGKEAIIGLNYTIKTPFTATTIRAFLLDSNPPTSRS